MLLWEHPGCHAKRSKRGGIQQPPAVKVMELSLGSPRKLEVTDRVPARRELHKHHQQSSKGPPYVLHSFHYCFFVRRFPELNREKHLESTGVKCFSPSHRTWEKMLVPVRPENLINPGHWVQHSGCSCLRSGE